MLNFNKNIKIGGRMIGPDYPTYFIAEIGGNSKMYRKLANKKALFWFLSIILCFVLYIPESVNVVCRLIFFHVVTF